jgi:hypothetical protein
MCTSRILNTVCASVLLSVMRSNGGYTNSPRTYTKPFNNLTIRGIDTNKPNLFYSLLIALTIFTASTSIATAATIWTDWTARTIGNPGAASGSMGSITVNYSGEVISTTVINGATTIWNPSSTFTGGAVDASPDSVGDVIGLNGSTTVDTLTFSSPVTNPVIAIWSLGRASLPATFTFDATPTLQVGGPNSIYGGSSIVVNGNTVSGNEGNGVVLFNGAYSSISWTSTNEYWYGFTVGTVQNIPIPAAFWLFGSGVLGLIGISRHKKSA